MTASRPSSRVAARTSPAEERRRGSVEVSNGGHDGILHDRRSKVDRSGPIEYWPGSMTIIFQRSAHVTRLLFGLVVLFSLPAADARTAFAAATTTHDVVVYGATPAGVAAAVAAAREGKSVALVEPLQLAGGMMSGGLSFSDSNQTARETLGGIFEEFYLRVETRYAARGIKLPYQVHVKDNKPWTFEPHVAEQVFDELLK